jgi:hypothetical protein
MQSRRAAARAGAGRPAPLQLTLVLATVAVAALLAACSSPAASANGVVTLASEAPGATAAPSASALTPQEAMLSYAQCMRDHGINMPDPVFSQDGSGGGTVTQQGPDVNPKTEAGFQAADTACKHFLDDVRREGTTKQLTAQEQQAFLDFAACMRDHGIDMADPTFEQGGVSIQVGGPGNKGSGPKFDPQSPAFAAAQTACQHFLNDAGLGKFGAGPATGPGPQSPSASAQPSPSSN